MLNDYLNKFRKLRIDRSHGIAPHKPILLISILQAFKNNLITDEKIYITPELVALFKSNWSALVTTDHHCQFVYPFFYMRSEKFWRLEPKRGYELFVKESQGIKSFNTLNDAVDYAEVDVELARLMKGAVSNGVLLTTLLDTYFPLTKERFKEYGSLSIISDLEDKILNEDAALYQEEVKKLIVNKEEEEIYLRGATFKKKIPMIYNNTCCISGLKIDATVNISMIDACHIMPFKVSFNDTITNGMALCPNLHRAFDRGIISIDENYRVEVSDAFMESDSDYGIRKFRGRSILLPEVKKYYPSQENLEWHRRFVFR